MKNKTKPVNGESKTQTPQPLFFKDPCPLNQERHATAGIRKNTSLEFSRGTNSVIITLDEIPEAARSYPIVFSTEKGLPRPIAVLGTGNENSFLTSEGEWDKLHYIPSYIRRYPFGLAPLPEAEDMALCVDESAPHFMASDADIPFFDSEGNATALTKDALNFCGRFQKLNDESLAFGKAISEADLLHFQNIEMTTAGGSKRVIENLQMLNKDKWHEFAKTNANSWEEKGYLALVVLILASQSNWKYLMQRGASA